MTRRFFLFLLVLTLGGAVRLEAADAAIRSAQERLKQGGFYFAEPNGVYDSATSAAVSRYQIRHGLPISGQLDAETRKALQLPAAGPEKATPPESETWRRLRKADGQFLRRAIPQPTPADANYGSVLVLSRERLRDYVGAFVLAGLDPQVGAELEFFADRVQYYGDGVVGREKIRRDLERYNQRWPQRRFWLDGDVKAEPQPDSRVRVTFPLRYELANAKKRSTGKVRKTLTLEVAGEDLQIVGVQEAKAR